jgi:cytochrome c oxidase subunit 2
MMDGWLPRGVSTFSGEVDSLFYTIFGITAAIFVIVEVTLIVFLLRYRHREGRRAHYIQGHNRAELIWTVVPFGIVVFLAAQSTGTWLRMKAPSRIPEGAFELKITAKQFEWNVTYPGPDGVLGTEDDIVRRNQLHLPVGRPIKVHLSSEDVIHSFFLPQFRVKQDAVPGMVIPVWFQATEAGEFTLGCAELCGTGHTRMKGTVFVHTAEDFESWQAAEAAR